MACKHWCRRAFLWMHPICTSLHPTRTSCHATRPEPGRNPSASAREAALQEWRANQTRGCSISRTGQVPFLVLSCAQPLLFWLHRTARLSFSLLFFFLFSSSSPSKCHDLCNFFHKSAMLSALRAGWYICEAQTSVPYEQRRERRTSCFAAPKHHWTFSFERVGQIFLSSPHLESQKKKETTPEQEWGESEKEWEKWVKCECRV